ncbi:hypothetical protein AVEN_121843-1 [Araneus ventricosus]|uniref:Uncharacterized protein n=1 Tax=Araneus ventricosus TaxID=182803 RepID=A0A4Y2JS81_ARAVE|nr:hypothetical protein AVEN_121843-1 [Araneus ventricosus]
MLESLYDENAVSFFIDGGGAAGGRPRRIPHESVTIKRKRKWSFRDGKHLPEHVANLRNTPNVAFTIHCYLPTRWGLSPVAHGCRAYTVAELPSHQDLQTSRHWILSFGNKAKVDYGNAIADMDGTGLLAGYPQGY